MLHHADSDVTVTRTIPNAISAVCGIVKHDFGCREEIARLKKADPGLNHKAAFAKAASMVSQLPCNDQADLCPHVCCCVLPTA